ncbi:hypothetical protein [Methylobacterium sp. AMS5]|uniref:hypothetical protein n=1 Tax=Methylobacterium sp. AMS5 TaxID=925818 RepID=UPI00074F8DC1|nr:hypothetical protein [Methylobacterium sp. AMS5]AMB46872.1 hypothetical protein Y590_18195 [Methylobacterium sp. AMS5]
MSGKMTQLNPGAAAPWTLERLGDQLFAISRTMDALVQIAEDHTKMLEQVLKAAAAPGESSEFSPLNRNLSQITQLLKLNGELLSVICCQVGGAPPGKP